MSYRATHIADNGISFDDKQLEFNYKLQYEEPRVKVVEEDPLSIIWVRNH